MTAPLSCHNNEVTSVREKNRQIPARNRSVSEHESETTKPIHSVHSQIAKPLMNKFDSDRPWTSSLSHEPDWYTSRYKAQYVENNTGHTRAQHRCIAISLYIACQEPSSQRYCHGTILYGTHNTGHKGKAICATKEMKSAQHNTRRRTLNNTQN